MVWDLIKDISFTANLMLQVFIKNALHIDGRSADPFIDFDLRFGPLTFFRRNTDGTQKVKTDAARCFERLILEQSHMDVFFADDLCYPLQPPLITQAMIVILLRKHEEKIVFYDIRDHAQLYHFIPHGFNIAVLSSQINNDFYPVSEFLRKAFQKIIAEGP